MEHINGKPSPFLSQKVKETDQYCLKMAKALHKKNKDGNCSPHFGYYYNKKSVYSTFRKYADGDQDTDIYKTRLTHLRNLGKGKSNLSFINVSWDILGIAPKIVENIAGKLLDIELESEINAIDPLSRSEDDEKKYRIVSYIKNKEFLEGLGQSGVDTSEFNPIPDGTPMPDSLNEIDQYMNLFFKNKVAEEFKDLIDMGFSYTNVLQVMKEYLYDLIKVGSAGIWAELDARGIPRLYKMDPENTVVSDSKYPDFRDATEVGFFQRVSISNLREMWPGQPEKTYRDIAIHHNQEYGEYDENHYIDFYDKNFQYPYDEEKVTIFNCTWQSVDKINHVIKNKDGESKLYEKDERWLDGVDEDEYVSKHPNNKPIRAEMQNWYGTKWIVGTNHVFDSGKKTSLRDESNLSLVKPNFILRRVPPIIKVMKPIFDEIQINFIKFKQHTANSRPNAISIEMSAFENISLSKSGKKLEPKEALALYFETGTILWRRKDWRGSGAQFRPVEELKNGIPDSAFQHLNIVIQLIDLLRELSGIPQIADGSIQDPRLGKGVAQMAMGNVKDTLRNLFDNYKSAYSSVADKMLDLTMDHITYYGGEMFKRALGSDSVRFAKMIKEIPAREFSISIQMGFSQEQRQEINELILEAQRQGQIDPEIAYMLKQIKNPYKAVILLKHNTSKKSKEAQQMEMAKAKAQEESNINSANASTQAEIQKLQAANELQKDLELFKANLEETLIEKKTQGDILVKMLDMEGDDKDRLKEMALARLNLKSKEKATA